MTDKLDSITWENSTRKLSELIPWEKNPRKISGEEIRALQESFEEFGQPDVIAIGPENELYNGHQRLKAWMKRFGDITIAVRVSSRALTEKERGKLTGRLHLATGEWDKSKLAKFPDDELKEWGFPKGFGAGKDDDLYYEPGELTIGPELLERHDYLVFYFDNEFDWKVATERLGVGTTLGGQVGKKTIQNKGIGRVLSGKRLLELLVRE